MAGTLIGYVTLAHEREFTQTYETASWYTRVMVPAGRYPVTGYVSRGTIDNWGVCVHMRGTVTASYFVNRVFTSSSARINEDVGKPFDYVWGMYATDLCGLNHTDDTRLELFPSFEIVGTALPSGHTYYQIIEKK